MALEELVEEELRSSWGVPLPESTSPSLKDSDFLAGKTAPTALPLLPAGPQDSKGLDSLPGQTLAPSGRPVPDSSLLLVSEVESGPLELNSAAGSACLPRLPVLAGLDTPAPAVL